MKYLTVDLLDHMLQFMVSFIIGIQICNDDTNQRVQIRRDKKCQSVHESMNHYGYYTLAKMLVADFAPAILK